MDTDLVAARVHVRDDRFVERPAARHNEARRSRAGRLFERQELTKQHGQPFRGIDVVREHDRRRTSRRLGTCDTGDVGQQIGGEIERPPWKLRPRRHPPSMAPANCGCDERARPARHALVADRQPRRGGWRGRERRQFADPCDVRQREIDRPRRDAEITIRADAAVPPGSLDGENGQRESQPQRPGRGRVPACRDEPHRNDIHVHS